MSGISDALRGAYDRLALPQPVRTRILLELSGDLEDMFRLYLEQGLPSEDAERRALESFDLSDEALAELAAVHCSPVRRFLDRLSLQSRGIVQRISLAVVAIGATLTVLNLATHTRILWDAGPFAWPVLAACVGAIVSAAAKLYQLYVLQDHRPRPTWRLLHLPMALAGAGLALGFMGMYGHVFSAWMASRGAPVETLRHLGLAVHRSAALLTVATGASVVNASLWFASAHKAARVEEDEAALRLGLADSSQSIPG